MGFPLRRTRSNTIMAGVTILVVVIYVIAFSLLGAEDTNDVLDDAAAVARGQKMRLLPAEEHDFRSHIHNRGQRNDGKAEEDREMGDNEGDVRWRGHRVDKDGPVDLADEGNRGDLEKDPYWRQHQKVNKDDNGPKQYDDNDDDVGGNDDEDRDIRWRGHKVIDRQGKDHGDGDTGDLRWRGHKVDDDNEEEEKALNEKGHSEDKRGLHGLIAKNMGVFLSASPKIHKSSSSSALTGQFLGYDRQQVQNCITNTVYGHLPTNLQTEEFRAPKGAISRETGSQRKESFHKVFTERHWGQGWDKAYDRLDASGRGATLSWSQEVIATLHQVINSIKLATGKRRVRVLDLPCGDMAWMSRFLVTRDDVDYTGIDIVPELIANHRKAYKSYTAWKFRLVDVLLHPLEDDIFDVIVNRMMLQHLYDADAQRVLEQFSRSNATVLLSTSFMRTEKNMELDQTDNPGRVRKLNLQLAPFSLTPPLCLVRDGPPDTFEGWDHFMGIWELPLRMVVDCSIDDKAWPLTLKGTDKTIFSCVDLR